MRNVFPFPYESKSQPLQVARNCRPEDSTIFFSPVPFTLRSSDMDSLSQLTRNLSDLSRFVLLRFRGHGWRTQLDTSFAWSEQRVVEKGLGITSKRPSQNYGRSWIDHFTGGPRQPQDECTNLAVVRPNKNLRTFSTE
jgi:hypothetical protein